MYPVTEKEVTEIVSGCKSKTSYGHRGVDPVLKVGGGGPID